MNTMTIRKVLMGIHELRNIIDDVESECQSFLDESSLLMSTLHPFGHIIESK